MNALKRTVSHSVKRLLMILNKEVALKLLYRYHIGEKLDLKNPRTYTQKLQWLKINHYDELMVKCTDKYLVREYIEEKGCGHILNDLYGVYDNAEDIDFDALPDSFVLKANHGCGMNIIVNDKSELDIDKCRKQLNRWLGENYYWKNLDWMYRDIRPRIIAEKNLCDTSGETPTDYKFMCFDGKPVVVKVHTSRYTDHVINYYDFDWNFLEKLSRKSDGSRLVERPEQLEEMIEISRRLSEGFMHVRVDLYVVDNKIYFSELTFSQGSGFDKTTADYDLELGNLFKLPINKC